MNTLPKIHHKQSSTLAIRAQAMLEGANVPLDERYQVFYKAAETATLLDGMVAFMINGETKTRYEHFFGSNPKFLKHLRTWGEVGTMKMKIKHTPNVNACGVTYMFVGYTIDHGPDCYDMLNPETGTIYVTRDIIWLQRMYNQRRSESITNDVDLVTGDGVNNNPKVKVRESKAESSDDDDCNDAVNDGENTADDHEEISDDDNNNEANCGDGH